MKGKGSMPYMFHDQEIKKGAFGRSAKRKVPLLINFDTEQLIGFANVREQDDCIIIDYEVNDKSLRDQVKFLLDTAGDSCFGAGFTILKSDFELDTGMTRVKEARLHCISLILTEGG